MSLQHQVIRKDNPKATLILRPRQPGLPSVVVVGLCTPNFHGDRGTQEVPGVYSVSYRQVLPVNLVCEPSADVTIQEGLRDVIKLPSSHGGYHLGVIRKTRPNTDIIVSLFRPWIQCSCPRGQFMKLKVIPITMHTTILVGHGPT